MPPLPVISNCVRVAFIWTSPVYSRSAVNVMHFSCLPTDLADLKTKLEANVTANMWAHATNTSVISTLRMTPLDGVSGSVDLATSGGAKWSGAAGSGDSAPQVAVIVKETTGIRGRSHRGRVYLPWCNESGIANGQLNSTIQGLMQPAWNAFRLGMASGAHDWQVASYRLATASGVTGSTVETQLATQRRRQPR